MERIETQKFYEWAGEKAVELAEELIKFSGTMRNSYKIRLFLSDANIPLAKRKEILVKVVNNYSATFKDLADLLLEKELMPEIEEISEKFARLVEIKEGIEFAKIESAFPLEEKELAEIKKAFGAMIRYRFWQNNELVGGFVLRFSDGRVFDASVKGKLNQMKMEIAG